MAEPTVTDEMVQQFLQNNFGAAFQTVFAPHLQRYNLFGNWLENNFRDRSFNRYMGAVAGNPNMDFMTFLKGLNPQQEWANLTPGQRGESPGRYAPQVSWKNIFGGR